MNAPAALPIDRIRRLAAQAETADDRAWLAAALERYLASAPTGGRLEDCLGIATRHGAGP